MGHPPPSHLAVTGKVDTGSTGWVRHGGRHGVGLGMSILDLVPSAGA